MTMMTPYGVIGWERVMLFIMVGKGLRGSHGGKGGRE